MVHLPLDQVDWITVDDAAVLAEVVCFLTSSLPDLGAQKASVLQVVGTLGAFLQKEMCVQFNIIFLL